MANGMSCGNPPNSASITGDEIDYQIKPDDGGPPTEILLGHFLYQPWWSTFWIDHKNTVIVGTVALAIVCVYVGAFGLLLLVAPARLAFVESSSPRNELPKLTGNFAFLVDVFQRNWKQFALPWFCRHARVRRAWIELYLSGKAAINQLGDISRSSFLGEPEVLYEIPLIRTRGPIGAVRWT
jgi:hypothetical protein